MRFMLMLEAADPVASDHAFDAGAVAALERYGASLLGAGVLLEAARLQSPGGGATVWLSHPRGAHVDTGPKQRGVAVQWFWLIEVRSLEEAIEWARRCKCLFADAQQRIVIRALVEGGDAPRACT